MYSCLFLSQSAYISYVVWDNLTNKAIYKNKRKFIIAWYKI
jgi:hypothetical protein